MDIKTKSLRFFDHNNNVRFFFAPGRVNIIGEHIDYNGGSVLPCSLSIGIYAAVLPDNSDEIKLQSDDQDKSIIVKISEQIDKNEIDGWGNYPKGVIKYLLESGFSIKGCSIFYCSTLPASSGLSSSAALELVTAYSLLSVSGYTNSEINRIELAKLCKKVENDFIGVKSGIMDQFAVAMGKKDNAILLNCNTLEYSYVPLNLKNYSLVIMNTGKKRNLTDSQFNKRVEESAKALSILQSKIGIESLADIDSTENIDTMIKDPPLIKRVVHVFSEIERVKNCCDLLKENKLLQFGQKLNESHLSLKFNYEASCFELDTMVDEALKTDGVIGARMTGAGWGGCAIAIVDKDFESEFIHNLSRIYKKKTGITGVFHSTTIDDGVREI